ADSHATSHEHAKTAASCASRVRVIVPAKEQVQGGPPMQVRKQAVAFAVFAVTAFALTGMVVVATPAEPSFSYGTMQSSCAPWDGPAIEIRLTTEAAQCKRITEPYISIAIWRELPIHAGQVVSLDPGAGAGSAARCTKKD